VPRYTIDELAQRSGVTSRNIRTYQTHGLLAPPVLDGRVGFYDDAHLTRLDLIRRLQDRGYSRVAIRDLLRVWEEGGTVAEVIGVEERLVRPWGEEPELRMTFDELVGFFGDDPDQRQRAIDLGFLRAEGDEWVASSRALFLAGVQLGAAGVPLDEVLEIGERLQGHADAIAAEFVALFEQHLWPRASDRPADEHLASIVAILDAVRPIPAQAASAAVELALGRAAEEFLVRTANPERRARARSRRART
jgi:DNA-binding transcriptional MerR regulator